MDSKDLRHIAQVYEAVYGGVKKKEEKKDTRLVVTNADKTANTPAWQKYKAGSTAYKAADHVKEGKDESSEEEEEKDKEDDDLAGSPNKKGKKKVKRWWDDDGDGKGYEKGEVKEEVVSEKKKPSVHDDYYDPMEDPEFDPHEAEATRGQSGRGTAGKMNVRKKYPVKEGYGKGGKMADLPKGSKVRQPKKVAAPKGSKVNVANKEITDLQKAAKTLKGKNVAKADALLDEYLPEKESYKTVAAVIDYDRSKKGTDDAVYDTEHGKKKAAKKERDYAAWERSKMRRDDPNWEHKKGSTSESVDDEYIKIVQQIKSAETQADIKRWGALLESGKFTVEELDTIIENDLDAILVRLESAEHRRNPEGTIKQRFKSRQTDPSKDNFTGIGDSIADIMKQNAAMKKEAEAKKKVKKEEFELDEAERSLSDRLARKRKLYDKTTKKAMEYARREGEAAGHDRFNMGRLDREMDKVKDKMNK